MLWMFIKNIPGSTFYFSLKGRREGTGMNVSASHMVFLQLLS